MIICSWVISKSFGLLSIFGWKMFQKINRWLKQLQIINNQKVNNRHLSGLGSK